MNTFGHIFRLTTFGESHGPAMGGIIDGIPAGLVIDLREVAVQLARRRPGTGEGVSRRREEDRCEFLSGLMEVDADGRPAGSVSMSSAEVVTLGSPIGFIIRNTDQRSKDYDALRHVFRPSHADYAWQMKYGIRDWRGGGRSSGRETVCRVVAGAVARQILSRKYGILISARLSDFGTAGCNGENLGMAIDDAVKSGDSIGGIVECRVAGLPVGLGEPVFGKLQQMLASAMMSIGGVKGFEYGAGFGAARLRGTSAADCMYIDSDGNPAFLTNYSGGIQGGISNGEDVVMRVAFKPTPTVSAPLHTIDDAGREVVLEARGRHDPCIAVRAVPVVESMAAITLLDAVLMNMVARFDRPD